MGIQNIYPGGESFGNKGYFCVPVSWYLAVDMQLYVFVAPIVLITYHYGLYAKVFQKAKKYMAGSFIFALLATSIGLTAWIVMEHNVMWQFMGVGDFDRYFWAPMAKLTYCAYLIAIVIQDVTTQSLINHPVYYNTWTMLSYWVVFVVGGYAVSFVCYMCVEAPFGSMLRNALSAMVPKPPQKAEEGKRTVEAENPAGPGANDERPVDEGDLSPGEAIFSPTREEAEAGEIELGHK